MKILFTSSHAKMPEHETKYIFENHLASMLHAWIRLRCRPDPQFESGLISSIYYDTRDWDFLYEKANSDYRKMKIRLRWYAESDGANPGNESFLEIKEKIGSFRKKTRIKTGLTGKWLSEKHLNSPDLLGPIRNLHAVGVKLPSSVFPVFQISYQRHRYIDPIAGSRVCIDRDICVARTNRSILPLPCPKTLSYGVFEFKGPGLQLPPLFQQLTAFDCHKASFSKYYVGYLEIMQTVF